MYRLHRYTVTEGAAATGAAAREPPATGEVAQVGRIRREIIL